MFCVPLSSSLCLSIQTVVCSFQIQRGYLCNRVPGDNAGKITKICLREGPFLRGNIKSGLQVTSEVPVICAMNTPTRWHTALSWPLASSATQLAQHGPNDRVSKPSVDSTEKKEKPWHSLWPSFFYGKLNDCNGNQGKPVCDNVFWRVLQTYRFLITVRNYKDLINMLNIYHIPNYYIIII